MAFECYCWSFEFRVSAFGFRVSAFGFRVSAFGFRVSAFGFRVSAFEVWGAGSLGPILQNPAQPHKTLGTLGVGLTRSSNVP